MRSNIILATPEAIEAQKGLKVMRAVPGWLTRGYWLCGWCVKLTSPIGDESNRCCWCGRDLERKDYVPPVAELADTR